MPRPRALIGLLLLAFAAAAAESVVSGLVRSAWYWQARARSDKAEDAWKQVLDAAPENPEALAAVGGFNARAGRLDAAREMLAGAGPPRCRAGEARTPRKDQPGPSRRARPPPRDRARATLRRPARAGAQA